MCFLRWIWLLHCFSEWFIDLIYSFFLSSICGWETFLASKFPQVAGIEFEFHPDAVPRHRTVGDSVKDQWLHLKESNIYQLVIKKYLAYLSLICLLLSLLLLLLFVLVKQVKYDWVLNHDNILDYNLMFSFFSPSVLKFVDFLTLLYVPLVW